MCTTLTLEKHTPAEISHTEEGEGSARCQDADGCGRMQPSAANESGREAEAHTEDVADEPQCRCGSAKLIFGRTSVSFSASR